MSVNEFSFELTGDYQTKLTELADSENVIKINPITATKSEFMCYQMYVMKENAKQIAALSLSVGNLSTKLTECENKVRDLETAATAKDEECKDLRDDLNAANLTIANQGREIEHLLKRMDQVDQCCLEQERHSRSSNVRIGEIEETAQEDCKAKVTAVFQKYGLTDIDIENTHRVGKKQNGKTRYMIVRFVRRTERRSVLEKRKLFFDGGNPIYEDIPYKDLQVKKKYKKEIEAHFNKKEKVYFTRGAWFVNDVKKYW